MNENLTPSKEDLIVQPIMNIYALRGHKVQITEQTAKNGNEFQVELVKKHLKIGQVYLIEKTVVSGFKTVIFLQGFPHITFNAVSFVDCEPQSVEDDKKHPDYFVQNKGGEDNVIPPMTDPLGKYWEQPELTEITIDDTSATMSKVAFDILKNYSHSTPSGVYVGKMWKCKVKDGWILCWYGKCEKPNHCSNNQRVIIIS